ncbi:MAG: alpha-ribazole phosphatase family protein [Methylobacter sp.]|uniref:Alpha-ribazole phosphatase family protein n=1 Tax=Candidatus Methylobacter titanis TaxID=3053457 RepID=A0AA43Q7C4_9GAMM|nr:alpha-ribazole phosphatase family protein [Candidatus Methylobacter titanis]
MDIYLIRHTQTATDPGLCYGQSDIALAASFADEMGKLHDKLPEFDDNCKVFSSPLTRCLQLAETFSDTVTTDPRLLELNFGDWEGQRFDDIDADVLQHWTNNFVTAAPPNGENFEDLYQRAGSFWQDLLAVEASAPAHAPRLRPVGEAEQVLVVTHAGVIRALLAHALNLPLANAFQLRIDSGSAHKLRQVGDYLYVEYINL